MKWMIARWNLLSQNDGYLQDGQATPRDQMSNPLQFASRWKVQLEHSPAQSIFRSKHDLERNCWIVQFRHRPFCVPLRINRSRSRRKRRQAPLRLGKHRLIEVIR
ncbi:uncharacterized protein LOC119767937 [Culex quinquefasciatus]|uniref:uncharacterized protein LOC119767937 n=2 Tax=Culex pipiens complex TaxID=518105 RepID=UPI0018E2CBC9|nr:uncharacterized protein LOC119767937 [Culex quinquefasciatus]